MDRGVSNIPGAFRDPGPARSRQERVIITQRNLPGLIAGVLQDDQLTRDLERYMARKAGQMPQNEPSQSDSRQLGIPGVRSGESPAIRSQQVASAQMDLPGLVTSSRPEPKVERDIKNYVERKARQQMAATRQGTPAQAPPQMRLDLSSEKPPVSMMQVMVDQSGRPIIGSKSGQAFLTNVSEMSAEDMATGRSFGTDEQQLKRVNNNPTPAARPSRPSRFGPANTPEKMSAKLDKRGATTPTEKAFEQLAAYRAATGMGGDAGLREYAQELVDEINLQTREAAKRRDPSTAETGMPSYVGEDLTNEKYERGGFDTRTQDNTPGPRSIAASRRDQTPPGLREYPRAQAGVLSEEMGGDQVPPYIMEVPNRGPSGQLDGTVTRIDPNQVVQVIEDNDQTASFMRSKDISMSEKAKELQKEERTPAISSTGLNLAAAQNRARLLTPDEIAAQDKKVKGDFTGKGLIKKPEDPRRKTSKKPGTSIVYPAKDREGNPKTITRDVPDGLYGVQQREEQLYRIGRPNSREFNKSRQMVREALGPVQTNPKLRGEKYVGPAPLVEHSGYRRNYEDQGAPSQYEFFEELANAGSVMPPDVRSDMRDLAEAAETGEMPMMSGQKRVTVPIRGSVESLYSGIDPRTSGNKRGQDSRAMAAGKQLRAFLQEAAEIRPVSRAELVEAAEIIGSRFRISASEAISAAAARIPDPSRLTRIQGVANEDVSLGRALGNAIRQAQRTVPAADPGRPLFAPGSFAEQILNQARAERSGNFREVDFFDESDIGAGMERIPEDIRLDEEIYQGGPVDDGRDLNLDDEVIEGLGGMSKGGYSVFNPTERPAGTVIEGLDESSAQLEQLVGRDVMESYVDYAEQFIPDVPGQEGNRRAQARMIAEQILLENPELVAPGSLRQVNASQLGIAEAISEQMNRPVTRSVDPAINTRLIQEEIARREAAEAAAFRQVESSARPQAASINTSSYSAINSPPP